MRTPLVLLVLLSSTAFADPVLRRAPSDYTMLAIRTAHLKNMFVEAPGCNVGVNCPHPNTSSACGHLQAKNAQFAGESQVVSDSMCGTESFAAVFRNGPGGCAPDCATISDPGPNADCSTPFAAPILGDLDGDDEPSCSADCEVDLDDVAAACGVTLPFPACDPNRPVLAGEGEDCSAFDVLPGNERCDLAPGTYGAIFVRDGARIAFGTGTTVICMLRAGKATRITNVGSALVVVPGRGVVKLGNASDAGGICHALHIVTERGPIHFGKHGDFMLDACSLASRLHLGHDNTLRGQYIGDTVLSDLNNDALCCTAPPPTTTTTVAGTTSTTVFGATTTTSVSATTTSTTLGGGGLFTRTIGFYKTHPAITQSILSASGPLAVCGRSISDVDLNHAHSAIEALCVSPKGDQRLQLARQLTGAALTMAAGGATFTDLASCNATCASTSSSSAALAACIESTSGFNESGDSASAPWGSPGPADSKPCQRAHSTACTILAPSSCGAP